MGAIASQIASLTIVFSTVYFRHRSKKTSKLRVTGLCAGNSPDAGEFPAQMASNAENVSIWWRHHEVGWILTNITQLNAAGCDGLYMYAFLYITIYLQFCGIYYMRIKLT